jgi:GNAT superfamily N-acetyltransferase
MAFVVRTAVAADLPAIVVLWRVLMDYHAALDPGYTMVDDAEQRWIDYIAPKFEDADWFVVVAEQHGEIIGYAIAMVREHPPIFVSRLNGFVETIAVRSDCRGRGVGSALVAAAEAWCWSRGVPEITVRIDERNPASKALFAAAGFEPWVVVRRKCRAP